MRCFGFHRYNEYHPHEGRTYVGDLGSLRNEDHTHRRCRKCGKVQMFMGENWYTSYPA